MDLVTPCPSQVNRDFWSTYAHSPEQAIEDFYQLSQKNDYIKLKAIAKNIAYCENCSMAANVEKAACRDAEPSAESEAMLELQEVHTPGTKTIEEVAGFLNIDKTKLRAVGTPPS